DAGLEERLGAGRLTALMGAGLERQVDRRAGGVRSACAAVLNCDPRGMQLAELGVETLSDHLTVAHEHGADQRIRAGVASTALREIEGSAQIRSFLFGADHGDARLLRVELD